MTSDQFHQDCSDLFQAREYQREYPMAARFDLQHHRRLERLMKSENRAVRIAAETMATMYHHSNGSVA